MDSWWELGDWSGAQGNELQTYNIACPFCLQKGNFVRAHHVERTNSNGKTLNYDLWKCENCGNLASIFWAGGRGLHDWKMMPWPLRHEQYPKSWPEDIGRYWLQAKNAQLRQEWDSAAVMARSALQLALRHREAKGSTVYKQIEDLAQQGSLPPLMKDWAHELRLLANESAHPTPGGVQPSGRDVQDVIEFLAYLLRYLFTLPTDIAAYRARKQSDSIR